jgi:predicted nucleic acid-binding protein
MAVNALVDAGFLAALLHDRDTHHAWAVTQAKGRPPPWDCCEAVLSEAFYILGPQSMPALTALVGRKAVTFSFRFGNESEAVLRLMQKYADVPMSFADACLLRMTEILPDPLLLTTDSDFRIYRRHGRRTVPCVLPR